MAWVEFESGVYQSFMGLKNLLSNPFGNWGSYAVSTLFVPLGIGLFRSIRSPTGVVIWIPLKTLMLKWC